MVATLLFSLALSVSAAEADPNAWDLTPIFDSDDAWQANKDAFVKRLGDLEPYRGNLKSPADLADALEVYFELDKDLSRLYGYASMRADEDIRESGPQGMEQALRALWSQLQTETAWFEPEILAIPGKKLSKAIERTAALAPYVRYLERLEKRREHVLDAEGEAMLGLASRVSGVGGTVSGILRNAEIPWPTITLADGTQLRVDPTGYGMGRSRMDRADRVATYEAFYGQLDAFEGSFAASLSATVNDHVFASQARGYSSSLEASLAGNEVDPAVYDMLVTEIGDGLPVLHRYLGLRAEMLGVDDLRYHDMYPTLVPSVAADYTWDRSKVLVLEALAPLGTDYVDTFQMALDSRWVDVFPREGKRSGAYVTDAAYEVHPYMLLNHTDDYQGITTLAHEGGHLLHSAMSSGAQPYPTSNYATFVAEVASTVNEVLLFEHLVSQAEDDEARLALLGHFLEGMRTTVFRQTMFAEFERDIHAAVEAGESLSADQLDARYLKLLRRYHGEAEGVTTIDERYAAEWAYIPHFHYDFYVYQYATSYIAAIALARGILDEQPGALDRYHAFLRAGSTKAPVALLREAGVDMASPAPMRSAITYMGEIIDRIEALAKP